MNIANITEQINTINDMIAKLPHISELIDEMKKVTPLEQAKLLAALRGLLYKTTASNDFMEGVNEMNFQLEQNGVQCPSDKDVIDMGAAWMEIAENGIENGPEAPELSFFDIRKAVFDRFNLDKKKIEFN